MTTAFDMFCGGGGASWGLHKAGFEVIGVDINPQPYYPFKFIQADALTFDVSDANFVWASPPCQGYSNHVTSFDSPYVRSRGRGEPQLIESIRYKLHDSGLPYVIENVYSAKLHMVNPGMLCGTMFGLPIPRHRLFESPCAIQFPEHGKCRGIAKKFAEENGWEYRDMSVTGKGRHSGTSDRWMQIMGIEHRMSQHNIAESIPPAYSEFIGKQVMEML